jgi:hypothetical protein
MAHRSGGGEGDGHAGHTGLRDPLPARAVKTQTVLDAARYRRVVEETGELLPGVEVVPAQKAFRVSFGKTEE